MHNFKPLTPARVVVKDNRLYNLNTEAFYLEEADDAEIAPSVFFAFDDIGSTAVAQCDTVILDLDFFIGLNFLACLRAKKNQPSGRLHVVSVAPSPLLADDLEKIWRRFPQLKAEADLLRSCWPVHTPGLHRLDFPSLNCTLDLYFGDTLGFLEKWDGRFDLALLGGFEPDKETAIWRPKLYYLLAQHAAGTALLVSQYASLSVRQGLERAGFQPQQRASGLSATFIRPDTQKNQVCEINTVSARKTVAVVGAGMAGVWAAFSLAMSGFDVTLLDGAERVCTGASGNPAGAFHPHLSIDDARMSKITRAGVSATLASLVLLTNAGLLTENVDWGRSGHVQLFDDEQDEARFVKALQTLQFPKAWVCLLNQEQASDRLGLETRMGGLYFSEGGWLKPERWCEAALAYLELRTRNEANALVGSVQFKPGSRVQSLCLVKNPDVSKTVPQVQLRLPDSCLLADFVVIAAAQNSLDVFNQTGVVVNTVKGQVSVLNVEKPLKTVLSGASYAISFNDREMLIGATFERPSKSLDVTFEAHQENYNKLANVFAADVFQFPVSGRSALRCAWLDRLPAIGCAINELGGEIPQILYATGFGSRGMTWAVLAGELLAARLSGRPSPLTQDLAAAVLPGRFFSRASNSKPTPPSGFNTR